MPAQFVGWVLLGQFKRVVLSGRSLESDCCLGIELAAPIIIASVFVVALIAEFTHLGHDVGTALRTVHVDSGSDDLYRSIELVGLPRLSSARRVLVEKGVITSYIIGILLGIVSLLGVEVGGSLPVLSLQTSFLLVRFGHVKSFSVVTLSDDLGTLGTHFLLSRFAAHFDVSRLALGNDDRRLLQDSGRLERSAFSAVDCGPILSLTNNGLAQLVVVHLYAFPLLFQVFQKGRLCIVFGGILNII